MCQVKTAAAITIRNRKENLFRVPRTVMTCAPSTAMVFENTLSLSEGLPDLNNAINENLGL
jgi:hypothetical protein